MKPRHAAALALVGWYLLAPPVTKVPASKLLKWSDAAPLSSWLELNAYDTAKDCKADLLSRIENAKKTRDGDDYVNAFRCIASDDPRLKSN